MTDLQAKRMTLKKNRYYAYRGFVYRVKGLGQSNIRVWISSRRAWCVPLISTRMSVVADGIQLGHKESRLIRQGKLTAPTYKPA